MCNSSDIGMCIFNKGMCLYNLLFFNSGMGMCDFGMDMSSDARITFQFNLQSYLIFMYYHYLLSNASYNQKLNKNYLSNIKITKS